MAPDQPHRDRPLRADPLSSSTAVLDRDDDVIDLAAIERARDAARRAASRPSATLPPLSRRADLLDWIQSKRRRVPKRTAARSPGPLTAPTSPVAATPDAPRPDPAGRTEPGTWLRAAPVRQLVEGAALCLVGVGLLLGWAVHVSWTPLLDVGLVVIGAVLVVQARRSTPSRPLMALGIVLAVVAVATWRADVTLDGGVGRRRVAPTAPRAAPHEYRLGAGQLTIDLRSTALTSTPLVVDAEVGLGRIVVRVPEDAVVTTAGVAGGGQVQTFGKRHLGPGIEESSTAPAFSEKQIHLDLRVGIGSVEVQRG
ncbi:MAG: hypothetical protein JWM47_863 [Acidimicrobiales bacterium]|nr:hypothetical protein [Acidimicrobiales bacterium]